MFNNILLGSYNQGDIKFWPSSGKQCTSMVCSYFLYTHGMFCNHLSSWDLDTILDLGNSIYVPVAYGTSQDYLMPYERPHKIMFDNLNFDYDILASIYGLLETDVAVSICS